MADSDCAISFSWCGNMRSSPPACRSNVSPRYFIAMAEHSMCQPGRPGPSASPMQVSPVWGLPQREIPGRILFVLIDVDPRAVLIPAKSFLDSLPYSGKRAMRKYQLAIFGLVSDVLARQPLYQRDHLRDVFGGMGRYLRPLDTERVQILEKRLLITWGVYSPMGTPAARRCE